ncbi:MAG: hypothetical protein HY446_00980 [Candidatus Niyogibacteria bacterium]|nr:hypothetical protein [Candidatus Niyogibacteria bacterium]
MSLVIATRGVQSEKVVDGRRKQVIPFVGADCEGEFAQMGVGLIFPGEQNGTVWGLVMPHPLIQSWRGMKILERIERIGHGTLCACWTIARRDVHDSDQRHLDELAEQVGGTDKLQALRDEVLASVPSADELNAMITKLREKGVDVDSWELEEEVKAGRIATSPLIETLARETEERRRAYKRKEEEVNSPLPREGSLGTFFEDLGIANFIIGGGIGGYGIDWDHIKLDELDRTAKRDSFSKYLTEGHWLEHTTEGPETFSAPIAPGVTMYTTSFGEIEQPWFVGMDGTKYTFVSAKFRDNQFHIKTKVEKREVAPVEGEYTISELRDMIGPLPPKPVARQGFLGKVASLFR